ncbi:unnamed protein product (macronuclear) [Paramecium tetraurelia]|uniref:RING-type domain-containing protein n=1 Tax=Paramecium tetraurelia TaxID=5888 RepID=A0DX21_PARTE|nr:uncharacterized protein GSPATT00021220001 [Paramecium tetraurelia]CAK87588.1 unnamed protein product [Paramecium tetraurelia]|eukprot:XP_001454985.1 hypothetical protein (macronuclear) [Paramecium tetraurelia strain d4-2]
MGKPLFTLSSISIQESEFIKYTCDSQNQGLSIKQIMNQNSQMLGKFYQFQSGFSNIITKLQDQAKKYNNCYNIANKEIKDYYNTLQKQASKIDQQQLTNNKSKCDNSLEALQKQYYGLNEQMNNFNQEVLLYQLLQVEFDNYCLSMEQQQQRQNELKPFQYYPQLQTSSINFGLVNELNNELQSIVGQQNQKFKENEQIFKFVTDLTSFIQQQTEMREEEQRKIKEQMEEQQRQQLEIQKQNEELDSENHIDTDQNENDENLSEAEDLVQSCQECGQTIKCNHFLTKCLHYYHEECILQKVKANYQQTSIYCSCNTLINSRMIKGVLEQCKEDQNQITFEIFQQFQIKLLLKKSNCNYTECKCGFFYISEKSEKLDKCENCENKESEQKESEN